MKSPALPLLALAVLVGAPLAWWTLRSSGERGRGAPAAEPAAAPSQEAPAPLEPPRFELAAAPAAPSAEPDAATVGEPSEPRRERAQDGGGRRVEGRVRVPAGAPADESLRVLALAENLPLQTVYGEDGVLDDLRSGKRERVLASSPVAADGAFELALAAEGDVWLALDGRFLYSPRLEPARAGVARVELSPALGGCLAGRVVLPASVADAAAAFEEIELEVGPDSQDFSMGSIGAAPLFGRGAELDAEGRFELRALPAGFPHSLEVDAKGLADAQIDGQTLEAGQLKELEVALVLGATLRGFVRDEGGAPIAGAKVRAAKSEIWGFPGDALASCESGADGSFGLEHVRPGKSLLIATQEGWLESEAEKLALSDGQVRDGVVLVLSRGASVSGRVLLPDGAAASGAEVQVSFDPEALAGMGAFNAARGASGKSTSGADGRFEVTGLGKGPFVVAAELERDAADGTKEEWRGRSGSVKPGASDVTVTLAAPMTLAGRVQDSAGKPVARFALRATKASGAFFVPGESRDTACDDPEGDFVLRNLDAGKWSVEAGADGFGPMTAAEVVLPRADAEPLVLVLAPAATISGTVVGTDGQPVSGARVATHVEISQRIQRMRDGARVPETTSGEDGSFLLGGLASGSNVIVASRAGFAASETRAVETTPEAPAKDVVLRLREGALVTGEVYSNDGKPLAGARIIAQVPATAEVSMTRAAADGTFRLEHMLPGAWTITALLEGGSVDTGGSDAEATASLMENLKFEMIQLEDGEKEHVVLGAPPKDPVRVSGTVRQGERGVGEGMLSFVPDGAKGFSTMKLVSLGADGRYEVELPQPGRYLATIQLTRGNGAFQQDSVEFSETIPEASEHVLDFALPLGAIRGTVRVPKDGAAPGTRVTLAAEGGLASGTIMGGQYAEATTDAEGRYSFEYLRPGTYTVAAGGALFGGAFGAQSPAGRLVRTGLELAEGKELEGVDFTLEPPGDIRGRTLDARGEPVSGAAIFVRDSSGALLDRMSMIASEADGAFRYTGVAPGEYVVSARVGTLASTESAAVRVAAGESANVELVLNPGTRLVVEVEDGEGEPVEASVSVLDERGRAMQGMLGFADMMSSLGDSGFEAARRRIGPLPPGTYTVVATSAAGKASKPVTLDGQPERKIKLRVR